MHWQDVVYRGFIAGSALLFIFLMFGIIRDYTTLAQEPTGSTACCVNAATFTVAIACGVVLLSMGMFLIRKHMRV
ncbi:MAG TPA: hypothetical protein PK154_00865 [Methanoregulaceae archaeon]|jgi:hypothetical protein|nr:hypothetical protein [Methanoregulaceae archaeon]HOH81453.1 hypothetical protein [Methanoregulaceae archaeon]HOW34644.1 hypothetical protein [Methanoregulaceae archaeon]HPW09645.1 hypothetical protein [Methanoregulaceae archaeon]